MIRTNHGVLQKDDKAPLYLDCDGVIIDTPRYTRDLILEQYGVDMWTHKRENVEDDKKVANFYKELNWYDFLSKVQPINNSIYWIKQIQESGLFLGPTVYTCTQSYQEIDAKTQYFESVLPEVDIIFTDGKNHKIFTPDCDHFFTHMYYPPFLVDDDARNLNHWRNNCGYAVPFNNGKPNNTLLGIDSLEELFDFVRRDPITGELIIDFEMDDISGYVMTKKMRETYKKN